MIRRKSSDFVNGMKQEHLQSDLKDGSDCTHLTSFGIQLQAEEAKDNEKSPNVILLCVGLLRRGMVYEVDRVLRVCDGFLCSMSATYDGAGLLWQW